VFVPVGARLLVVEAQGVEQLVLDDRKEDTPLATQRDRLASPPATNEGEAPRRKEVVLMEVHCGVYCIVHTTRNEFTMCINYLEYHH